MPLTQQGTRPARPLPARSGPPRPARQAPAAGDDIPEFDRNKVSLDFPGNLFGPSVSLLIKTTKIIGDVIQNSAVRYQSFLRLFRPLFRGPFEIKGLDPATTTTTTTTTAPAPLAADNEKGSTWRRPRPAADDAPVLDRNKVSLELPGNLLGPTLSLLIDVTKVIGDVIQNSAVRFQSFLRLLRPLFRGPFELRGLDPPPARARAAHP